MHRMLPVAGVCATITSSQGTHTKVVFTGIASYHHASAAGAMELLKHLCYCMQAVKMQ